MANYDIGTSVGHSKIVDRRTVSGVSGIAAAIGDEAYKIADIRAALTTANSGYYTSAFLDTQTYNDLIFALRYELDSGNSIG